MEKKKDPSFKDAAPGLIIITILLVLFFKGCVCNSEKSEAPNTVTPISAKPKRDKLSAAMQAHLFIENRLIAPSQADFPIIDTAASVQKYDENSYIVTDYVDAPNRLGVKIRMKYLCSITYFANGDSVQGKVISLEEQGGVKRGIKSGYGFNFKGKMYDTQTGASLISGDESRVVFDKNDNRIIVRPPDPRYYKGLD